MSKDFAIKLKKLRKDAGVTQEELAKVLGVGRTTISEYERGVIEPKRKTLIDIAFYFNVPVDYFFIREEIINTNRMLHERIITKDILVSIQDIINDLTNEQIPTSYNGKKLSANEEKIIVEMLKNIFKIVELL